MHAVKKVTNKCKKHFVKKWERVHPQLVREHAKTIPTHNLVFELFVTSVRMLFQPYSFPFFAELYNYGCYGSDATRHIQST